MGKTLFSDCSHDLTLIIVELHKLAPLKGTSWDVALVTWSSVYVSSVTASRPRSGLISVIDLVMTDLGLGLIVSYMSYFDNLPGIRLIYIDIIIQL